MSKGLGVLVLVASLLLVSVTFAGGDEEETPRGFLSFSFDPARFFQAGPAAPEVEPESEGEAPEGEGETEPVGDTEGGAEVTDTEAVVSFALYGLFRYESAESLPDTFKMPGAYVRGEGEWKNYKLSVMVNAAIPDNLIWAYVDMAPWANHKDKVRLRVGVLAVPFGMQMRTFAFDLSSIEYSLIVQNLTNTIGVYDMGAMLHGFLKVKDGGLRYSLAVLNGEFANTTDTNEAKTFAGRLGFEFFPYFKVGSSYYRGKTTDLIWNYDIHYERAGIDLLWLPGDFKIRGEYIRSIEDPESHYSGSPPVFNRGESEFTEGWWIDAGIVAWVNSEISDRFVKRGIEIYGHCQGFMPPPDPGMKLVTGHANRVQFVYGLGVNVDLSENVRFQVLWQHLDFGSYNLGKYAGLDPAKRNDRVLVQLAVAVF